MFRLLRSAEEEPLNVRYSINVLLENECVAFTKIKLLSIQTMFSYHFGHTTSDDGNWCQVASDPAITQTVKHVRNANFLLFFLLFSHRANFRLIRAN